MGKMKELYTRYLEEQGDEHLDDEYHYEKWLKEQGSKSITMEESIKLHDDWWNSLTEKEKQKIADEHQEASDAYDMWRADWPINEILDRNLS